MARISRDARRQGRRALDRRFPRIRELAGHAAVPKGGWIRAVRQALGMSAADLARRMGVTEASVVSLEVNEQRGRAQLDTLSRAARAMDCELVYAIVPRGTLESAVERRARNLAAHQLGRVSHSMDLEQQRVSDAVLQDQLAELTNQFIDKPGLWSTDADR